MSKNLRLLKQRAIQAFPPMKLLCSEEGLLDGFVRAVLQNTVEDMSDDDLIQFLKQNKIYSDIELLNYAVRNDMVETEFIE